MVPGGGAPDGPRGRRDHLLSHGDRLASPEKARDGAAQQSAWETVQRAHAIANGCYVAAVNRVGLERPAGGDGLEFWGQSFVAGPGGQVLVRAPVDREEVLLATVDLAEVDTTRTHWPFLRDRRIDAYGDLTKRFTG